MMESRDPREAPMGAPPGTSPMDWRAPIVVTTTFEVPGMRTVRALGLVRGIVVRSRSIFGTIGASLQSLAGGNITLWTEMCEHARREAFDTMVANAQALGANAVVGMRFDSTEVAQGTTEVLAYGTAVHIEPLQHS